MTPGSMKVFAFADEVARRRAVLVRISSASDAAAAVVPRHELLRNDAAQRFADHDADLLALIGGENVEHAVERAGGVAGVQGAEHEVAGFRGGDGERDGFQVAHFPDHDDVRIFAQRAAQRGGEGLRVRVHFALGDVAAARSR